MPDKKVFCRGCLHFEIHDYNRHNPPCIPCNHPDHRELSNDPARGIVYAADVNKNFDCQNYIEMILHPPPPPYEPNFLERIGLAIGLLGRDSDYDHL